MDSPGRLGSPQGTCGLHWYVMRGQPAHRWPGLALTRPNIEQSIPFHPKRKNGFPMASFPDGQIIHRKRSSFNERYACK